MYEYIEHFKSSHFIFQIFTVILIICAIIYKGNTSYLSGFNEYFKIKKKIGDTRSESKVVKQMLSKLNTLNTSLSNIGLDIENINQATPQGNITQIHKESRKKRAIQLKDLGSRFLQ